MIGEVSPPAVRIGGWMTTFTGIRFYPADPRPEEVEIEDIAHSLSHLCRFAGHCKYFYPVASHSMAVAELVGRTHPELRFVADMHDSTEAYLVDVPRPVKEAMDEDRTGLAAVKITSNMYRYLEYKVWGAIAERFGLPKELPEVIKHADRVLLVTEARELLNDKGNDWAQQFGVEPLASDDEIVQKYILSHSATRPSLVKTAFLESFARYAYPTLKKAGSA